MNAAEHGGNLFHLAQVAQCPVQDILDFSVNLRPEGPPVFLQKTLLEAMDNLNAYPSPHAQEASLAAAKRYNLSSECFVFGNGSNELIHTMARFFAAQGKKQAYIVEPAFSEYALACTHAGLETIALWGGVHKQEEADFIRILQNIPLQSLVFMANPANPSGLFYSREELLVCMRARPDLMWIMDEAFIEYVGREEDMSLISMLPENVIVLRSLTKFHAIAGVRLGFLVAHADVAQGIRHMLPAWTVNCFALQAALAVFHDASQFSEQTRRENTLRREHLVAQLQDIGGIEIFPSVANYVLFRHKQAPQDLSLILLKRYQIAIRDCSNYYGLEDKTWYRVAVRFDHEHERLCTALKDILM